jgi:hypothetical protein
VLLDVYEVTRDESLLRDQLLVLAPPFLRFLGGHYTGRDADGKMLLAPAQALETWWRAVNPLPEIAGLQWVLKGLLALPTAMVPDDLRREWEELSAIVPPIPTRSFDWGQQTKLIPALQYDDCRKGENAELYAVFPYRHYGAGKPGTAVGVATYGHRQYKSMGGWSQDGIQAALLGLTDEARRHVVHHFSTAHTGSRFPAFWGPNADWIPDQDHGSVASVALQRMLLQWDGERILLLPAWPRDWDVDFRLHAPANTVVEGVVRQGRIARLTVTPRARMHDVECEGSWFPPGMDETASASSSPDTADSESPGGGPDRVPRLP